MIPGETEKTEMMGSIGAVIKTPSGVESSCSSGNRLLDHALVDRVVTVEPCWTVPWNAHVALGISILEATRAHAMKIARIPRNIQQGQNWNGMKRGMKSGLRRRRHRREPKKMRRANPSSTCGFTRMRNWAQRATKLGPCTTDGQQLRTLPSKPAYLSIPILNWARHEIDSATPAPCCKT